MELQTLIKTKALQRKDWIIGLGVIGMIMVVNAAGGLDHLERKAYEWSVWLSSERLPNEDIAVVAIDEPTLEKLGPWPFSRHILATVNQIIAQGRPKSIGYTIPFSAPENQYALELLGKLRKNYNKKLGDKGVSFLDRTQRLLDTDQRLADSFREAGSVVLAMPFHSDSQQQTKPDPLPDSLQTLGVKETVQHDDDGFSPGARFSELFNQVHGESINRIVFPMEPIARAASGLGLGMNAGPSQRFDRIDAIPLAMTYGDHYVPSFPLLLVARGKNIKAKELVIEPGRGIKIGDDFIETDSKLRVYPYFYKARDDKPPFKLISFSTVLEKKVPAWAFQYKTVLVGLTAPELVEKVSTPIGEAMSPVVAMAHNVSSLVNGDLYVRPAWVIWGQYFAYCLVAVYLMFLLPKLRMSTGLVMTGLLLVVLFNIQFVPMITGSIWMSMMVPIVALIIGYSLLAGKRIILDRVQVYQARLSEANLLLGQAYQSQSQYDKAFASYRKCNLSRELLATIYHLGLDLEAKRQFGRASEVFKYIQSHNPGYKDITARIGQNDRRLNAFIVGTGTNGGFDSTLIIRNDGLQKPMLGRYRVDKELGKGEMGVVYLGKDPKIGRMVAIKTMALSEEFDEEHLPDVRARFLREAEAAGRLNHPNIVTIYDVGEEQDLAYIAMDYLRGVPMSTYTRPENLLPVDEVFNVVIQVAAALDCAHRENVVHRDIKPANIIYDREVGVATVTDFGVACLTDVSKTKSGVILGSPAFMSPEQLEGETVDGRSDIFSLGVTFYQLLTGESPFAATSLSSLMYKIANQQHEDVRSVRPELPECVSQIINTALNKDMGQRFPRAGLMASVVRRCMQRLVDINTPHTDASLKMNIIQSSR